LVEIDGKERGEIIFVHIAMAAWKCAVPWVTICGKERRGNDWTTDVYVKLQCKQSTGVAGFLFTHLE
jgi:hypothetical protein